MQNFIKIYHAVKEILAFALITYTSQTNARQSIVAVMHTSGKTMLKCIGKQNLVKIDNVVQDINKTGPSLVIFLRVD